MSDKATVTTRGAALGPHAPRDDCLSDRWRDCRFVSQGGGAASALALALACGLMACGGGQTAAPAVPMAPVTPLPATLAVTAPAGLQALDRDITFGSSAGSAAGLQAQWQLGDGQTSALSSPSHRYTQAGSYTVSLALSNEVGQRISATGSVTVADLVLTQGKACQGGVGVGWCWQRPSPQGNALYDQHWPDDQHGWAVGDGGTVVSTADGGSSWQVRSLGAGLTLQKVQFVDSRVGWLLASGTRAFRSADGGQTWQPSPELLPITAERLVALSADVAWVTAGDQAYLTEDAGARWRQVMPPPFGASGLVPVSASTVWALPDAAFHAVPQLGRSVDAGRSWSTVDLPPLPTGMVRYVLDLQFTDPANGLLVVRDEGTDSLTGQFVFRPQAWLTRDGGATWTLLKAPPSQEAGQSASLQLAGADTVLAWVPGTATVHHTRDAGATWANVALPGSLSDYPAQVRAMGTSRLLLRDGGGRSWVSLDRGATWRDGGTPSSATAAVGGLWFFDRRRGIALDASGTVLTTSDGGLAWRAERLVRSTGKGLQFAADGSVGWVLGDDGQVLRSTDQGLSWAAPTSSPSVQSLSDLHFVDLQRGWAISSFGFGQQATVYRSVDGGATWQAVPGTTAYGNLASVRFADAEHGVIVGPPGTALVSVDAGQTWQTRPTGSTQALYKLAFVDAQRVIAVGAAGTILRSDDRGLNWTAVTSPSTSGLRDVRFVSASTGYAAGDGGVLLATRDGGLTWRQHSTGAATGLTALYLADAYTVWAAGARGTVLVTADGGADLR